MLLEKLRTYFQTSPAVSLLRSPNAPFILDFLIQLFKQGGRITVPYSELHAALVAYREGIQESYPDALQGKIEAYLSGWCSQETRWLHRFLETGRNEPVYQLTPHTEDALAFLDRVLQQDFGFVGTESRLRLVANRQLIDKSQGYAFRHLIPPDECLGEPPAAVRLGVG